ncbi:MAG: T9SS type A sorting domain-containing protein [Saprospiraceae bacterium]|nr:T9SS type A sorting domain-containing protein [Saprospiraceae bacterium]
MWYRLFQRRCDGFQKWRKNFFSLKNGLPNTTVFKIVFNEDESLIYAATEAGPYVYVKSLEKWFLLSGSNTPNQIFWSVEYLPALKIARFGTYGRGIWDFHFKDFISSSSNEVTKENTISLYPNPASEFIYISFKDDNTILNRFGIFDVQGNKVEIPVEKINDQLFKINTSTLADGIYFIINYHSKNESIKKFIKLKQ